MPTDLLNARKLLIVRSEAPTLADKVDGPVDIPRFGRASHDKTFIGLAIMLGISTDRSSSI